MISYQVGKQILFSVEELRAIAWSKRTSGTMPVITHGRVVGELG